MMQLEPGEQLVDLAICRAAADTKRKSAEIRYGHVLLVSFIRLNRRGKVGRDLGTGTGIYRFCFRAGYRPRWWASSCSRRRQSWHAGMCSQWTWSECASCRRSERSGGAGRAGRWVCCNPPYDKPLAGEIGTARTAHCPL